MCSLRGTAETICPLRSGREDKAHWVWRVAQFLETKGTPCHARLNIPLKTLMRLRWYVVALEWFAEKGQDVISSRDLAERVGVGAAMVRKDFSHFGDLGTPGLGYHVTELRDRIHAILDQNTCRLAWVGAKLLADAEATFAPTLDLNFKIVAAFDNRPEWIGQRIGAWVTRPLSELSLLLAEGQVDGVVLALPENARNVADSLIQAGAKGILNLTPVTIAAPPGVNVRHVDLIGEMMALAMEVTDAAAANPAEERRASRTEPGTEPGSKRRRKPEQELELQT